MRKSVLGLALAFALALVPRPALGSDHADPVVPPDPGANITGLFFYPKDDRFVLVFNVRRALTAPGPYELEPFLYTIHIDLDPRLSFDKEEDRLRYGGTIEDPAGIESEVQIEIRLNDDASLKSVAYDGLLHTDGIEVFTGLRDDPFIFPRFFKRNVISMVLSVPQTALPGGVQDWLLWATTTRVDGGELLDIVGRSNRSQQGRFNLFINKYLPHEQVPAIMEMVEKTNKIDNLLNRYALTRGGHEIYLYTLKMRKYDVVPDVMVYTNRFPVGFPNGRLLTDDVAKLTCDLGDCVLYEVSFIEGDFPRATVNDKPFLDDFPYLAEPWPASPEPPPPKSLWPWILLLLVVIVLVLWLLCRWCRRRGARKGK
jgi:hypothetical protein